MGLPNFVWYGDLLVCSFDTRRSSVVVVKQHNVYVRNYNFIFKLQYNYMYLHSLT